MYCNEKMCLHNKLKQVSNVCSQGSLESGTRRLSAPATCFGVAGELSSSEAGRRSVVHVEQRWGASCYNPQRRPGVAQLYMPVGEEQAGQRMAL
jgi:hypothetical protein